MCAKFHDLGLSRGSRPKNSDRKNNNSNRIDVAVAPYNFVRLNGQVVKPPIADIVEGLEGEKLEDAYRTYLTEKGTYSGYFDVTLTNMTSLYINAENKFFSKGSHVCIPGSSLRGCLKNTFKIITNSTFRSDKANPDLDDSHLYYRSFAAPKGKYKDLYDSQMLDEGKRFVVTKAGFLVKSGQNYFVCPAQLDREEYPFKKVRDHKNPSKEKKIYNQTYTDKIFWRDDYVDIHTGAMPGKGHFYRLSNPEWDNRLEVSDETIREYENDITRNGRSVLDENGKKKNADSALLKKANAYSFVAPCFYVADGKTVKHFGANPYYRIPYNKSIGEHVFAGVDNNTIDFTDAVFGRKEEWSSRVLFDDLYLVGKPKNDVREYHKILSSPKPTSFQMYLEPLKNEYAHWDEKTSIRGYKMYWHTHDSWMERNSEKQNDDLTSVIEPLKEGNVFKGKIRFEKLDAQELGALCALFNLGSICACDQNHVCYKLGMGKPIGMGSVKIEAKLYLQQEDYYQRLFDGEGFAKCEKEETMTSHVQCFKDYMKQQLVKNGGTSWELYTSRIKELGIIMDFNIGKNVPNWENVTRYLDISLDRHTLTRRFLLPHISDVVKVKK